MLNKKVIESLAVCGLCMVLSIAAVTNTTNADAQTQQTVASEKAAVANTSLDSEGYAGVSAALLSYEKSLLADDTVSVETLDTVFVAASADEAGEDENDQTDTNETQLTAEEQEWQSKLMPTVEESLNVRAAADENSEIVGKLYKGSVADIVEQTADSEWIHITSGNVDGYVNKNYCVTGTDALSYAHETCGMSATVNTDGLRLRADQNAESEVITALSSGTKLDVDTTVETAECWTAVKYNSQTRYVSSEYVTVALNTSTGKTIAEEQAEIAAQKAAEEEAAKKAAAKKAASSSSSSTSSSAVATTQNAAVAVETDDVTLLAAIIECEAGGQSYDAQLGVGAVIMNRVRSGSYPSTISGVVYQKGQFGPASSGKLASKISSGKISSTAYAAAQAAISGTDNTGGALHCNSASSGKSGTVIGSMVFY